MKTLTSLKYWWSLTVAASVELEETKEEDFRSLVLGEDEVVPPMVDLRTTAWRRIRLRESEWNAWVTMASVLHQRNVSKPVININNKRRNKDGSKNDSHPTEVVHLPLVMPERNVLSSVASSRLRSCFSRPVKLPSRRWSADWVIVTCRAFSRM